MKKLLFTLLYICIAANCLADDITAEQAQQIAEQFLGGKVESLTPLTRAGEAQDYYVFNKGSNGGFVIVSGTDAVQPILGFSDKGSFSLAGAPANVVWWMEQMANHVRKARSQTSERRRFPTPIETLNVIVEPFVDVHYNQSPEYQTEMPYLYGYQCYAGCVAISVAQVMAYYKWPKQGMGSHRNANYDGRPYDGGPLQRRDFSTHIYDWDNPNWSPNEMIADVGTALNMDYYSSYPGSGASMSDIVPAMAKYFGYRADAGPGDFREDLKAKRPVILSGILSKEGAIPSHSFIMDGYALHDKDEYVHLNFGWGGNSDGFYIIFSGEKNELSVHEMICNIRPAYDTRTYIDGVGYEPFNDTEAQVVRFADEQRNLTVKNRVTIAGKDYSVTDIHPVALYSFTTETGTDTLQCLDIPSSVKSLRDFMFDAVNVKRVALHNGTTIGKAAFINCQTLENITLPEDLKCIPDSTFLQCRNLRTTGNDEWNFIIPQSVKDIGVDAFGRNNNLELLVLPKGVRIGERAFACYRPNMGDGSGGVIFAQNLEEAEEIGDYAFSETRLGGSGGSYDFKNLKSLGEAVFQYCNVKSIILPASTTHIGCSPEGHGTYYQGRNFERVFEGYIIHPDNPKYSSIDGALYNKERTVLIETPQVFKQGGFMHITSEVIVPEGVEEINSFAFTATYASITLPRSLKVVHEGAFRDITWDLYSYATTPPTVNGESMGGNVAYRKTTLHVPSGCKEAYEAAHGWDEFLKVVDDLPAEYPKLDDYPAITFHQDGARRKYLLEYCRNPFMIGRVHHNDFTGEDIPYFTDEWGKHPTKTYYSVETLDSIVFTGKFTEDYSYHYVNIMNRQQKDIGLTAYSRVHKVLFKNKTLSFVDGSGKTFRQIPLDDVGWIEFAYDYDDRYIDYGRKYYFTATTKDGVKTPADGLYLDKGATFSFSEYQPGEIYFSWRTDDESGSGYTRFADVKRFEFPKDSNSDTPDRYNAMKVTFANGSEDIVPLKQLYRVTFSGMNMNFHGENGQVFKNYDTKQLSRMTLVFDEATGIHDITAAPTHGNNAAYNLQGIRVGKDYKGIVIRNGKKVLGN